MRYAYNRLSNRSYQKVKFSTSYHIKKQLLNPFIPFGILRYGHSYFLPLYKFRSKINIQKRWLTVFHNDQTYLSNTFDSNSRMKKLLIY